MGTSTYDVCVRVYVCVFHERDPVAVVSSLLVTDRFATDIWHITIFAVTCFAYQMMAAFLSCRPSVLGALVYCGFAISISFIREAVVYVRILGLDKLAG